MFGWLTAIDRRIADSNGVMRLDLAWAFVRRTGFVLWVTRASVVMMLLTVVVFFSDQVSDATVQLSEAAGFEALTGWLGFFLWEALWAFAIAYGARVMLMFDFGMLQLLAARGVTPPADNVAPPEDKMANQVAAARESLRWHIVWWPRLFALLGPLGIAWALLSAKGEANSWIVWMAACSVLVGAGMLVFMIFRRRLLKVPGRLRGRPQKPTSPPPIQPIFVASAVRNRDVDPPDRRQVPKLDQSELRNFGIAIGVLSLIGLGLFINANWYPESLTSVTSSPSLIFMIAASWMPLLLILVFISHWRAFPIFLGCLVLGAVTNWFLPDNHAVTLVQGGDPRPLFDDAVAEWKAANPGDSHPIVVATAGGGIRAAYWTATVLGALQDCTENLDKKVFAISGVSGGSVGAATYAALLRKHETPLQCHGDDPTERLDGYRRCGQAVLSHNLLSAPLVAYAYKDVLLNITRLNAVINFEDRAAASERALQAAWSAHFGDNSGGFTQPFLAKGDAGAEHPWTPAFVFNSTSSLSGRRVAVSSLDFPDADGTEGKAPLELHDILYENGRKPDPKENDITLGTGAFLSARFPVISPAGTLVVADNGKTSLHTRLVDGGYYENNGAETAEDIFVKLRASPGLQPIVVQITSDPSEEPGEKAESGRLSSGLESVGAPMWALWNTRNARGRHATAALKREAGGAYFQFSLWNSAGGENGGAAPLGWMLSKASQSRLNNALTFNVGSFEGLAHAIAPEKTEKEIEACKASWTATPQ